MQEAKKLIEKIESDGREKLQQIVSETQKKIEDIMAKANAEKSEIISQSEKKAKESYGEVIARSKVVANLDTGKILLEKKRALLDKCFSDAEDKLVSLPDREYLDYIVGVITKWAEDGDEIIISAADERRITQKFVSDVAVKIGKKLTLSKEKQSFKGGIILRSGGIDKNLTTHMVIKEMTQSLEGEVLKLLGV